MKKENYRFVCAVVVAAGKGSRMNMDINKQYIEIGGIPVLARTLKVLESSNSINEIILVVNESDIVYCKQDIVDRFSIRKVKCIVAGGSERQESVFNGLGEISPECDIVLIHDGARPFLSEECITDSIHAAYEFGAACVAVPVKDTVKEAQGDNFIVGTLDRNRLWAMQTPQVFRYTLIFGAHKTARNDGFIGTDDAVLVERLGIKVKLVMGSYFNIKITTQEDLVMAEAIAGL